MSVRVLLKMLLKIWTNQTRSPVERKKTGGRQLTLEEVFTMYNNSNVSNMRQSNDDQESC